MREGAIGRSTDVAGRLVVLTDYGCYPADADYVALVLKLHKRRGANGYEYPRKDVLTMLMFGDFMDYLSADEKDCE